MSVSDKLKIIADSNVRLAAGESLKSICRLHSIQPHQLRSWRLNVGKLSRAKKSLKSLHKGFRGRLHNHEEELVAWVLEMREQGVPLCYKHIVIQAIHLDPAFGDLSFEAQYGAVRRMCIRNSVTIRRVTHTAQADPQDAIDLALQWIEYVRPIVSAPNVGKMGDEYGSITHLVQHESENNFRFKGSQSTVGQPAKLVQDSLAP